MQPTFIIYVHYFSKAFYNYSWHFIIAVIQIHLADWAELFLNFSVVKAGSLIPLQIAAVLFTIAGILFLAYFLYRLFSRRLSIPLFIKIYIIAYGLLIFNWPFFDSRFWFPLLPLVGAIALMPFPKEPIALRKILGIYKYYYVLTGVIILGYFSYLSFDRSALTRYHDNGIWKAEYELHFNGTTNEKRPINSKALHYLDAYD
jgi:hypothetical protein